jgi:peptide/nickel transport system substrate-binding protein
MKSANLDRIFWTCVSIGLLSLTGCSGCGGDGTTTVEFNFGDLVEPFDPPKLEELEKTVEWEDRPVVDALARLRELQATEEPLVSVEEALRLENTSDEANQQILSALGKTAQTPEEANLDETWVRHTAGDVKSTNPILVSSTAEFDVVGLIGFGLFGFDWNMEAFASKDSVVSWQSSKDGMYDKVVLRDDLTWSDGKPITAHDVEFTFKLIMTEAVPVPAVRSGTEDLKYVKAYDDRTVVFFHEEPLATNVWNINFSILPKHIYEKTMAADPTLQKSKEHVALDENPVAGGPYILKERTVGDEIVCERRESYYMVNGKQVREKPFFKEIRFKVIEDPSTALLAVKKGDIEEMAITPEQWVTQTGDSQFYEQNTKVRDTEWVYFYFGWNCKTPFFEDARVRNAMGLAFDHDEMLTRHQHGLSEPGTGIFHPASIWAPDPAPEPLKQDRAKAEELLDAAGWTDSDGDGFRDKEINGRKVDFEFTILVSNRPDRIDICNLLAENLDDIGIKCNVRPMEFTVLQQKSRDHQFQAMFAGWGTGTDPDTSSNIWTVDEAGSNRNYVQYDNKKVDALFEKGKRELDEEKRIAIYQEIAEILWEDQPYTWLYYRPSTYAFNKDLRGYKFSPRGPYNYSPGTSSIYKPAMK